MRLSGSHSALPRAPQAGLQQGPEAIGDGIATPQMACDYPRLYLFAFCAAKGIAGWAEVDDFYNLNKTTLVSTCPDTMTDIIVSQYFRTNSALDALADGGVARSSSGKL